LNQESISVIRDLVEHLLDRVKALLELVSLHFFNSLLVELVDEVASLAILQDSFILGISLKDLLKNALSLSQFTSIEKS
jgi:hypothetical protein